MYSVVTVTKNTLKNCMNITAGLDNTKLTTKTCATNSWRNISKEQS